MSTTRVLERASWEARQREGCRSSGAGLLSCGMGALVYCINVQYNNGADRARRRLVASAQRRECVRETTPS